MTGEKVAPTSKQGENVVVIEAPRTIVGNARTLFCRVR